MPCQISGKGENHISMIFVLKKSYIGLYLKIYGPVSVKIGLMIDITEFCSLI